LKSEPCQAADTIREVDMNGSGKIACVAALASVALALSDASAENLTSETRKLLAAAKLDAAVMQGLDKELAVPAAMVEAAKKEGKVRVQLTLSATEFDNAFKVFAARYPGIEVEYSRGIGPQTQKALVAARTGNPITDVIATYDSRLDEFHKAGLLKVSDLPAYQSLREDMKTPSGVDAADKLNYWCTTYSSERVDKANLPKTWDDLLTIPAWRKGRLALATNAGQTFLPTLAIKLGDAWTTNFLDKLFHEVKPQLRKETLAATGKLIAVGEFDLVLAIQDYVTERDALKGIPVAAHCPEPVVAAWGKLGILKDTPYPNAARLYVNWHISKEGQIANYHYGRQVPVHAALDSREFMPYPEQIIGKKILYRTDDVLADQRRIITLWRKYWEGAGGN
jgi:iron(III) transport system substrate-binding protein